MEKSWKKCKEKIRTAYRHSYPVSAAPALPVMASYDQRNTINALLGPTSLVGIPAGCLWPGGIANRNAFPTVVNS